MSEPKATFVKKEWGHEYWFVNKENYCGKMLYCRDGIWSSGGKFHYHKEKDETFFVTSGELNLQILEGDEIRDIVLKLYCAYTIAPGVKHRFRNLGKRPCRFFEVSDYHQDSDSYRVDS